MRIIKFRGKCLKAGEWFYGHLHCVEDRAFLYTPEMIEVDPDTVGQFTGIVDKNGVEVYEGDIVRKRTRLGMKNCLVTFEAGSFCCGWGYGSSTVLHPYLLNDSHIQAVGNKYDNPDLLEQ